MAKESSFDIQCKFDMQEVKNAVDQAKREIQTRFDFKGVLAEINVSDDELTIKTESDYKIQAMQEILINKLVKRDQSPKILDITGKPREASGMNLEKKIPLVKALSIEEAKKITKIIKENFKKVKSSIQGDVVRVSASSKDDLQKVMDVIKNEKNLEAPIFFTNFR